MNRITEVSQFIKDVCSVVPMPKSEVRSRLSNLLIDAYNKGYVDGQRESITKQHEPSK